MTVRKPTACLATCLVLLTLAATAKAKPTYVLLPAGDVAWAINDSDTVAGVHEVRQGFLRLPDGTTTYFAPDDSSDVEQVSINAKNAIAGYFVDSHARFESFLREPGGKITSFDDPHAGTSPYQGTVAQAINLHDEIAGFYIDDSSSMHGFLRSRDGTITDFDVAQTARTEPLGINDHGTVVGDYLDSVGNSHAFLRTSNGEITTFDAPGSPDITTARGINNNGSITGYYDIHSSGYRGYIRAKDGSFVLFNNVINAPLAINADGEVTGTGLYAGENGDTSNGFIGSPSGGYKLFHVADARNRTYPLALNNSGTIVGIFTPRAREGRHNNTRYGFIRTP